jgi:hypothetical protein
MIPTSSGPLAIQAREIPTLEDAAEAEANLVDEAIPRPSAQVPASQEAARPAADWVAVAPRLAPAPVPAQAARTSSGPVDQVDLRAWRAR